MDSTLSSSKGEPGWWRALHLSRAVAMLLLAAILTAAYTVNDGHIMHNVLTASDTFTAVMAYLTIGGWVGLAVNWILCQTRAGKWVDPDFQGIHLISPRAQLSAVIAGSVGALSTLFMLWGSQLYDPSIVLPLSNVAILYVVFWEASRGVVDLKAILVPALLVVVGAVLSTFDPGASVFISLSGLVVLLVLKNGVSAFAEILEKTGVCASDATCFGFWRFLWLTVVGTSLAVAVSWSRGFLDLYWQTMVSGLLPSLPWVILTMLLVYFGIGLKNAAKKRTSVSVVTVIFTLPVVLGVPMTAAVNFLWPGTFADAPVMPITWVMRFVGAALILWGIVRLQRRAIA